MPALGNSQTTVTTAVPNTGTITIPYPTGLTQALLNGSTGGRLAVDNNDVYPQAASGAGTVAFSFGASNITVTNNSGVTWGVNQVITASFGDTTKSGSYNNNVRTTPVIAALTAATGTASDTISDVGASFSQATLNNNFKSLSDKYNTLLTSLKNAGILAN